MTNVYLPIVSVIISLTLIIVFYSKKRIKLFENTIYSIMLFSVLLDSLLVSMIFINVNTHYNELFVMILNKIDFMFLIIWSSSLFLYMYVITYNKQKFKNVAFIVVIVDIIVYTIICLSDIRIVLLDNIRQTAQGSAVNISIVFCVLYIISTLLLVITNIKKYTKRYIPVFIILFTGIIIAILFSFNPFLICISFGLTFNNLIMYFTIENPDLQMIEQLNILKDQADKANNAKTEFLSSMSHEIRTPLNAINGFAQLILEEENIDTIKEETKDIIAASDNLIEIVNGILDISKIEANKLEIVNVEYEPSKIFDELVKLTKARIGEKSLDFRVSIAEDLPDYLNGDYVRLKQIVLNLLTNAVKYTQEGYVDFSVKCIKKDDVCRLFINVKDSGIGIKPENITKLFSKFERFDKEKNMTIEGTGLGLAITKKLIDLMGGNINVSSLYGEGSIFSVVIDQRIVDKVKAKVIEGEVVEKKDYSDKKVLIVDDNLINLKVAGRLLGTYKVNAKEVSSGFDCLKLIEDGEKFDLILMDDMMPKMSGVETFQKLCEKDDFHTPVVALTANAIAGMKEKYLDLGFNDYISKPIDKKELERVLKTYLK